MILTHNHLDHTDPEPLETLLKTKQSITVLAPCDAWRRVRQYGGNHNYALFDRHTEWMQGDVKFRAVLAVHSDLTAIGVVMEWDGKTCYITGDTLYSKTIFADLPREPDVLFLPINGVVSINGLARCRRS